MYYLWLEGAQAGPFTLQQVQAMWNAGQITALTLYWQEGSPEWLPLNNILSIVEPSRKAEFQTKNVATNPFAESIASKTGRIAISPNALPDKGAVHATPVVTEDVLWTGHPTLWKWAGLLIFGLILLLAPVGLFLFFGMVHGAVLAPIPIALIIFLHIYLTRNFTTYTVTTKHVGLEVGIFSKKSRELRVQDIRSIAAETNFLGYGDIEFASAASDDAEVIFHAVARAGAIRDMVKKLQN